MDKHIVYTTVLKSSEGFTLTNKDRTVLSKEIWLAASDLPSNYEEITDEEAEKIRKKREEENK